MFHLKLSFVVMVRTLILTITFLMPQYAILKVAKIFGVSSYMLTSIKDSIQFQFKFICITLFTIHIDSKQLYRKCITKKYMEKYI